MTLWLDHVAFDVWWQLENFQGVSWIQSMLTFTWLNRKARENCSFKSSLTCAMIQR